MATTEDNSTGREPMSPKKRKIYQQLFQKGSQLAAKGEYAYAIDCFKKCVLGDTANRMYAENLVSTLQKKYGENKLGTMTKMSLKTKHGNLTQLVSRGKWEDVLKTGISALEVYPYDAYTLSSMAKACENLEFEDTELYFYDAALKTNLKDPDLNIQYADALDRSSEDGDYSDRVQKLEQAVRCYQRVKAARPTDPKVSKRYNDIQVRHATVKSKYEDAERAKEVQIQKKEDRVSPEDRLKKAIKKDPTNMSNYLELAELLQGSGKYQEAEQWLEQAAEKAADDDAIQDQLMNVKLRIRREAVDQAKADARDQKTEAAKEKYDQARKELLAFELEHYQKQVERYPNNVDFQFAYAERLEQVGKIKEAITAFQKARGDQSNQGPILMGLGRCFQRIKQYQLALDHYRKAVESTPSTKEDELKDALYRTGKLALGLKNKEVANEYLNRLASMDFGYKDVADLLMKVSDEEEDDVD